MITENNLNMLYRITSNLSYADYQNAAKRYKPTNWTRAFNYCLSGDTLEALEHYGIARQRDITIEQEESVKAYLLKIRFCRPELIEQTNPNYEQWKRVSNT